MTLLSPARTRLALLALALGGFGIGATEFVAMGLLPDIARDVLPGLYATSASAANAQTGIVISAYAAGVVVGAPTIAAFAARFPRKRLLLVLAVAFTLGTVISALAPTFETLLAARFLAGLPHGAYFGIASLVAASLMGPGKRGQGVALVLSGLTIANVIGVPAITFLGQQSNWRIAYGAVALIFAVTTVAIALVVPRQPGDPSATLRRELKALKRPLVWIALGTGAIGFGGFFAVYSYVTPLAVDVAGLPAAVVPLLLATVGLGMTAGTLVGGRLADRHVMRALLGAFAVLALGLLGTALFAASPVALFLVLFVMGWSGGAVGPAVQTRLMDVAGDSQTLAAAMNHSALNIGNSLGAALGAAVIAAGLGYQAPAWVGLLLCAGGFLLAGVGILVQRSQRARNRVTTVGIPLPTQSIPTAARRDGGRG